jgi:hypothetical protein
MANQNREGGSINDKLTTADMGFYNDNNSINNAVERQNNRTVKGLVLGLALTLLTTAYMFYANHKKEIDYKLMPELQLIDQLYGYQVNALDKKSPTFDEAKDALKKEHQMKVTSIRETYKDNGIIN